MNAAPAQFAAWLEKEHPDIFEALYAHHAQRGLSGLGDDGLTELSFDPGDIEVSTSVSDAIDLSNFDPSPVLENFSSPVSAPNIVDSPSSGTAGGILSAIGNAASSIGGWLVSPQGLNTLANVGTAVLKVQVAQDTARMQTAVIQANAQRAALGKSPIPITYTTTADGHVIPVYDTGTMSLMPPQLEAAIQEGRAHMVTLPDGSTGYSVDNPTLSSLLGSTGIPWYVWLVGLGLLALIAKR